MLEMGTCRGAVADVKRASLAASRRPAHRAGGWGRQPRQQCVNAAVSGGEVGMRLLNAPYAPNSVVRGRLVIALVVAIGSEIMP